MKVVMRLELLILLIKFLKTVQERHVKSIRIYLCQHYRRNRGDFVEYIIVNKNGDNILVTYVSHNKRNMQNTYEPWTMDKLAEYLHHIIANHRCLSEAMSCSLDKQELAEMLRAIQ